MKSRPKLWTFLAMSIVVLAALTGVQVVAQVLTPREASPADSLLLTLARAYSDLDDDCYASLFADEARHGVDFRFVLFEPNAAGEREWGYAEEMRIHRRMFRPDALLPGDGEVPPHLQVRSIDCTLVPQRSFRERFDLYRSEMDPAAPLDRHRWRAAEAEYRTAVVWHLETGATFRIAGFARFVVIEDRTLPADAPGKLLLYRWEDLGPGESSIARASE